MNYSERLVKIEAIKGLSVYDICDLLDELEKGAKVQHSKIQSLESEIEQLKKENDLLLKCVKRYAGYPERRINGRPKDAWNCEGFNWIERKSKASWLGKKIFGEKDHTEYVHVYMNNVGMIECGGGSEIAEQTLKELGERDGF